MATKPEIEPDEAHEPQGEDGFDLAPEEEAELEDRYQEMLRGNYIDGDEFLARWERRGRF